MRKTSFITTAAVLACGASTAWAARPLATEDAAILEKKTCEFELQGGRTTASGASAMRDWETLVACGVGAQTQLFAAYGEVKSDGIKLPAVALGGKTNVAKSDAIGWTLAYALGAVKEPGSSYKLEDLALTGVMSAEIGGGWLGHVNLGLNRSRSARQTTTSWSAGLERPGEFIFAIDAFGDDRNKPGASTGVGWEATKGLILSATYEMLFEKPRIKRVAFGAKLEF